MTFESQCSNLLDRMSLVILKRGSSFSVNVELIFDELQPNLDMHVNLDLILDGINLHQS